MRRLQAENRGLRQRVRELEEGLGETRDARRDISQINTQSLEQAMQWHKRVKRGGRTPFEDCSGLFSDASTAWQHKSENVAESIDFTHPHESVSHRLSSQAYNVTASSDNLAKNPIRGTKPVHMLLEKPLPKLVSMDDAGPP